MILVVDNYDSFTWNLVQLLRVVAVGMRVEVVRNDACTLEEALAMPMRGLVLSPGPGLPRDAGISLGLVQRAPEALPVLGVCLGHQTIAEAFGARVVRAPKTMHGRTSTLRHDARGLFEGLPNAVDVMRYHSWCVDASTLPRELEASAHSEDGVLMAMRHRSRPIESVQFHPESFASEWGEAMMARFVARTRA
jgi:anthranilate synthase component 2